MRIGLINPRGAYVAQNPWMKRFMEDHRSLFRSWLIPNLGLLTIAGMTPEDIEVEYVDENIEPVDFDEDYDLVALSGMTQQACRAYAIATEFRNRGVHTVIGGPHATVMPEEVQEHIDTVIVGEAEGVWEDFLQDFRKGAPRRAYFNNSLAKVDLSRSPVPRYDLIRPEFFAPSFDYKMIPVQTTRGCPRDCDFCSVPQVYGKAFRMKSVSQVIADVEEAKKVANGLLILFSDDNMFINRRFSKELLKALLPLKIRYMAQSDIAVGEDKELLRLMYQSGCVMVLIGLESLSFENLKQVDGFKAKMLERYSEYVQRIQSFGIAVLGAFIVGFDHDDLSTFQRIADFVLENAIYPQVTIATPLPRTAMTDRLLREGRLPEECYWDRCTYYDAIFEPRGMTKEQLERGVAALHELLLSREVSARRRSYFKAVMRQLKRKGLDRWEVLETEKSYSYGVSLL
ncbi:MAG: B12-binding domain-containing radical SAM protein [Deltaproteobacteria bacterium]|nr:B12-binding domain-containing radical SAM protein [Deltaproteobacteria bacterium]